MATPSISPETSASTNPNLTAGERLTDALAAHDLERARQAYTPDARIWHSHTQRAVSRDEDMASLGMLLSLDPHVRFDEVTRIATAKGCVQTYVVRGSTPNGTFMMPICEIVEVEDGRIARMFAYFDPTPMNAVIPGAPSGS